jgi:REP element-mobilizing transposase RayT
MRSPQLKLLASEPSAYGGTLLKTRKGRSRGRPLAVKNSMHLVLRSSRAKGDWSFRRAANRKKIENILAKFSRRFSVKILSIGNVGNHLHLQIQLSNRFTYRPFIRAITAAIAMAVTGRNRWTVAGSGKSSTEGTGKLKFWDYRPYTRIVIGFRALLGLRDYIRINQLEGYGYHRREAEFFVRKGLFNSA